MTSWDNNKRHIGFKKVYFLGLLVFFGGLVGIGAKVFSKIHEQRAVAKTSSVVTKPQEVQPTKILNSETLSGRYLFNGTIFWGRGIESWSKRPDGTLDYAHPFSALATFKPEQYDAWEADLECPITNRLLSFQQQIDTLIFNCRPEYLPEMAKYFKLIDLANNHTDNRGAEGLAETRKRLGEANVQYFGSYDPSAKNDICEVVSLPVRLKSDPESSSLATPSKIENPESKISSRFLPVAFCAWHYFYRKPLPDEIETMRRYQKVMPVFAFIHMGSEYNATATAVQREIAHKVADENPEFVIANNPHWVQDSEIYKGKLIVYSTGNFIFDQLDFETQRSASIDISISSPVDDNLRSWLEIGEHCKTYQDNCLSEIESAKLTKPKLSYHYDAVAGDSSHKLTKYNLSLQQGIYDRLKWAENMKALGQ